MWLSVRVSVAANREFVERRTLCPSCGSRPRRVATVTKNEEIVEQDWWCPGCFALIKTAPRTNQVPQIATHYKNDVPLSPMN